MSVQKLIDDIEAKFYSPPFPQALVGFDLESWEQIKSAIAERDELLKALEFIARNKPLLMTDQNQCEVLCYPLEINPSAIATQAIFKAKGGA
jgi:hypothetical protein